MNWFYKFEKKYEKYAIKNLMLIIIVLYGFGYIMNMFYPDVYREFFSLNAERILHGEVWRIVTFIIQPPSNVSIIFIAFVLYFYYMIGNVLERTWGAFRFNVYFFTGVILHVIAALIVYAIFGVNLQMNTYYLNLALFMAFALEYPDMKVMLFFVLPIKIKWLAIVDAVYFGITIIAGILFPLLPYNVLLNLYRFGFIQGSYYASLAVAIAAFVSMLNFIFFLVLYKKGPALNQTQRNYKKAMKTAKRAQENRRKGFSEQFYEANSKNTTWKTANAPYTPTKGTPKHRCVVCGRTELDAPDMVFRYCSKCDGNLEYCEEHLYTHVHVKKQDDDNVKCINM